MEPEIAYFLFFSLTTFLVLLSPSTRSHAVLTGLLGPCHHAVHLVPFLSQEQQLSGASQFCVSAAITKTKLDFSLTSLKFHFLSFILSLVESISLMQCLSSFLVFGSLTNMISMSCVVQVLAKCLERTTGNSSELHLKSRMKSINQQRF